MRMNLNDVLPTNEQLARAYFQKTGSFDVYLPSRTKDGRFFRIFRYFCTGDGKVGVVPHVSPRPGRPITFLHLDDARRFCDTLNGSSFQQYPVVQTIQLGTYWE